MGGAHMLGSVPPILNPESLRTIVENGALTDVALNNSNHDHH